MADFIDMLDLPEEVKLKLRSFGATNGAALLSLIDAAPEAAKNYLGCESFHDTREKLSLSLSNNEKSILKRAAPKVYLGAQVGKLAPVLRPPSYDVAERDKILERIKILRSRPNAPRKLDDVGLSEIEELESLVSNMLRI